MKLRLATLWVAAAISLGLAGPLAAESPESRLQALGDEFLDGWFTRRPHLATRFGLHGWDRKLIPVTEASVASDLQWLAQMRLRLHEIPRDRLPIERAQEHDLLAARIERERIELEEVRSWERDPAFYVDLVAGSVLAVLERDFTSPCERVQLATRRLRLVPEVLRAARVNLKHPPRIFAEAAIARFEGALDFYRGAIPALTAECREPMLHADLAEADSQAVRAVEQLLQTLRADLVPRAPEGFALGRDLLQRRLAACEMEETPVESLLASGWTALDRTRERMAAVAERIAPGLGIAAALDSLASEAPAAGELAPFVEAQLDTVRAFLRGRALLTVPAGENLTVRETPAFRRGLSPASVDPPGVWERRSTRAYLDVTPDPPGSGGRDRDAPRATWNRAATQIAVIHEALPGRYWQMLSLQRVPSRLRQALGCETGTEGWAHYCEQMMVEEGFGEGDPRVELAQLERTLRQTGRLVAGLSLHTGRMSLEEAGRLFEERCFLPPAHAAGEARRAALDPGGIASTPGRWRILALREEARRALGPVFKLREFHDSLLRQGSVPLPLAREGVLHEMARRHRSAAGSER